MATMSVNPTHLEEIATHLDDASTKAADSARATGSVSSDVWVSHGVLSCDSNNAFDTAAAEHAAAANIISQAANNLAAQVRAAAVTYSAVDEELSGNLDKQVLQS